MSEDSDTSILKKLRDTAMNCTNSKQTHALQDHANLIVACVRKLDFGYRDAVLRELNGLWVRSYVLIDEAQKPKDNPGGQTGAGAGDVLLQIAA